MITLYPESQSSENITPYTDRGVEFSGSTFGVHWLTVTVHIDELAARGLYDDTLRFVLGDLEQQEYGGLGYKAAYLALGGFRLFYNPPGEKNYCTFSFPGSACEAMIPEVFIDFFNVMGIRGVRYNVTRLDLAFDGANFTPTDFYKAVENEKIRSLAKRATLRFDSSPYRVRDDGSGIGCDTCYLGSRSSERMVRVYNRRGFTRLEMEVKGDRANLIAGGLFTAFPENWISVALSHLRDYIDVMEPWWEEFISGVGRAFAKVVQAADKQISQVLNWLVTQVSAAYSTAVDYVGEDVITAMMDVGRAKRSKRAKYRVLLAAVTSGGSV